MLFNSFEFLILVACTFALYYTPALMRWQVPILIAASALFYAAHQPVLLLLLLVSLAINVATSYQVIHGDPRRRRFHATLGVIFNLATLLFFKYGGLIADAMPWDPGSVGELLVSLPLPLGISFFTFHGITLLVDTYRAPRRLAQDRPALAMHARNVSLYFLFFPQLVAGPITKSRDFLPQIQCKRLAEIDWEYVFQRTLLGFFLKIVVADNLAQQTYWIAYPYFHSRSSADLAMMLIGYSMQIFADFAGYSLIAIGIASLFGYRLPENFNSPYLSKSFSEFWGRWHISLSSFLKEYLYVPLGGNRRGPWRTYVNLFLVMLLGGLWHGAAWSFMVWGGAHGAALVAERALASRFTLPPHPVISILRIAFVFLYVSLAWLLFKLTNFGHAVDFGRALLANWHVPSSPDLHGLVAIYSIPVVAYHFMREYAPKLVWAHRLRPCLNAVMLFLIATNSGEPKSFVYFQF